MMRDKLQYFSVESQQQPSEGMSRSRSQQSHHNRSTSGSKKKIHQEVQVITPTKKEENDIKQNISHILNQILQRTNNIPIETQQYFKERFNLGASQNHSQSFQDLNSKNQMQKQQQMQDNSPNKQSSLADLQQKKQDQLMQLQYLDELIKQEIEQQKEDQELYEVNYSPSFHQPDQKLQVQDILKNKENFQNNNSSENIQKRMSSNSSQNLNSSSSNSKSNSSLSKSQGFNKKSIQSERTSSVSSSKIKNKNENISERQVSTKKDLTSINQESISFQECQNSDFKSNQKNFLKKKPLTEKKINSQKQQESSKMLSESNQKYSSISYRKSIYSSTSKASTSVRRNMNSTIIYQEDVTIYQKVLRQRHSSLISDKSSSKNNNSRNRQSQSTVNFQSANSQPKQNGGRQYHYESVKKELFKDFQSFSDQFVSQSASKSQNSTSKKKNSDKKDQSQQHLKEYKKIIQQYEEQQSKNQVKKQQVQKQQEKLNKDIIYYKKLKDLVETLKKDNKRLVEPLNNQVQKLEEQQQLETHLKKQEFQVKQLERENLSYQTQIKKAMKELQYWQSKDKPKEIRMSLNGSTQSSVFSSDQPQINIKISQSDIYSALTNNIYNGQTYNQ